MNNYAIAPAPNVSLPIVGSDDLFPVRRIYCVGKNYKKHVAEMGGDPERSTPVFFTKSRESIVQSGTTIPYPPMTGDLHFELELVVAMQSRAEIFGYGVGLDMTRRDLQGLAKGNSGPWDMAKNFDQSAPCGALMRREDAPDLSGAAITLHKDGKVMQNSTLDKMIWSIDEIITHLNATLTLAPGDLIFTGTPEGVGPVLPGQTLMCEITGLPTLEISYCEP